MIDARSCSMCRAPSGGPRADRPGRGRRRYQRDRVRPEQRHDRRPPGARGSNRVRPVSRSCRGVGGDQRAAGAKSTHTPRTDPVAVAVHQGVPAGYLRLSGCETNSRTLWNFWQAWTTSRLARHVCFGYREFARPRRTSVVVDRQ